MGKRLYPSNVIRQAQEVLAGWNQIAPVPTFGTLTATILTTDVTATTGLDAQITTLEAQLTDKRNLRDAQCVALWDKVKRVRSSVKGIFGDDSTQYELVGGTRLSDRKPVKRKVVSA
jgi:hypothetical protein